MVSFVSTRLKRKTPEPETPLSDPIVAYTFLLDNKAQDRGFVNMSDAHRTLWFRTFLAKNYYV